MIRKPFYRKFRKGFYETLSEKGASVLRYRGADNKEHYIAAGDSADVMPGGGMTKVTWQELKDKRDAGKLTPGALYRITDYQCTTTQVNTRSAGHQFDIVLLALSEDKLAEEGWAMEHPTDVYDVTFDDGVTKKCYLNFDIPLSNGSPVVNIVDVETLQGIRNVNIENLNIDREAKTAITEDFDSTELATEGLQYNYFQNSNLSAWKVWYSLDNDKDRFAWADSENGKGVIYRMIDEHNNDCPYDFKNIQFKRWAVTECEKCPSLVYDEEENPFYFGIYNSDCESVVAPVGGVIEDIDDWVWCYTFHGITKDAEGNTSSYDLSSNPFRGPQEFVDYMIEEEMGEPIEDRCYNNIIGIYGQMDIEGDNTASGLTLPNNVFFNSSYCIYNEEDEYWEYSFAQCYANALKTDCHNNTFGNECYNNTFGNECYNNTFGNSFQNNTLGEWCTDNTFGNNCYNNTFGNYFQNNTFGNNCYNNTFGNNCGNNTFGNGCNRNTFGNGFQNNTLGEWCTDNTFGNYCNRNTFGNNCGNNTFGNNCGNNTFGNNFEQSSIGDGVNNITVSKDYVKYIIIENGNQKITITSTATTSSSQYVRNIAIALGTNNSNSGKTISHNTTNDTFKTTYQNSNSTTKNV